MMKRKVQIEVTSPVQDPATGEVQYQPGTRFDEGAKELDGLPAHMLRAVLTEEPEKGDENYDKDKDKDKADDKHADKPGVVTPKPGSVSK
jgi:hypothetical protein